MKTKKIGRPPVSKADYKGVLIGARFTSDESKAVHAAIKRSGIPKSDWIRKALIEVASSGSVSAE